MRMQQNHSPSCLFGSQPLPHLIIIMTSTQQQQQLIHHTDYPGVEPAILFVHGFTCDETDWSHQVEHFGAAGQRVITVDLPGHGKAVGYNTGNLTMEAMSNEVVTLLHHLQVKSTIVVGHSMGTIIATEIATQAPEMVVGIALIDGSRKARGDAEEAVAKSKAQFKQVGFTQCMTATFEPMFLPDHSDEKQKRRIINRACAQPEQTSIAILLSAVRWSAAHFEDRFSQLKVPVQVVQSSHRGEGHHQRVAVTPNMYIEWHHELKKLGVDAEFDLVTDCGHFTMLDKPDVVNTNIERLLKRVEPTAVQAPSVSAQ